MSQNITCPACLYTRKETDLVPDWECPKCQRVYAKIGRTMQSNSQNTSIISPEGDEMGQS